jgi:hypothetical protein
MPSPVASKAIRPCKPSPVTGSTTPLASRVARPSLSQRISPVFASIRAWAPAAGSLLALVHSCASADVAIARLATMARNAAVIGLRIIASSLSPASRGWSRSTRS